MRITAGYTRTDYKTNTQIAKELKITPILDKLLDYKRNWIQHVYRMPRNRLPRVMKHYSPAGRRDHGRLFKRFLKTWDRNGTTSGPAPWQMYDDDDIWSIPDLCVLEYSFHKIHDDHDYDDCFSRGTKGPSGPGLTYSWDFTITLRHSTVGRTPLDEWLARRRDLYLTTHNTHKR